VRLQLKKRHLGVGALALCVVLAAASARGNEALTGLPRAATPETVGLSSSALDQLDREFRGLIERGERAGLVYAIARRGQLVVLKAHGLRDLENGAPMTVDSVFRIYSQTRTITSVAMLTLVERGELRLDDRVASYLPQVGTMRVIKRVSDGAVVETEPQKPAMTVRHLLQYSAGLGYAPDWPPGLGIKQREILDLDADLATMVDKLTRYPLLEQPGSKWRYGYSSDLLGRVAEVALSKPFNRVLRERVTGPLGMRDTDFWLPADALPRLATVYSRRDGVLRRIDAVPSSTYDRPTRFYSAGGGLVASAPDYLRFAQMLLDAGRYPGGRILRANTVRLMSSNTLTDSMGGEVYWYRQGWDSVFRGYGWGLGIGVRLPNKAHTLPGSVGDLGWGGLASTGFFVDPSEQLVAVVMSQYIGPQGDRLAILLREGVYRALLAEGQQASRSLDGKQ
jgi:CubicO group peptidase (beta-lactamase class C family)